MNMQPLFLAKYLADDRGAAGTVRSLSLIQQDQMLPPFITSFPTLIKENP